MLIIGAMTVAGSKPSAPARTCSRIFEGGVKQVEAVGGAKDIQAVFKTQAEIASAVNEKLVGHAKKTAEILTEAKDDYAKLMEEGMKVASDNTFLKNLGNVGKVV